MNDARYGTPGLLRPPNRWDFVVLPGLLGLLFLIAWGSHQMTQPYTLGQPLPISLAPSHLPDYALRTTLRMALALASSFLFTFSYATLAAKSRRAERVLIPLLDVLQSVPILGFLSITVAGFLRLFHGSLLGPEAAAVFAIFTSQAWNMAFSFYYSLKMLPKDLVQAADLFGLSPWKRFWKLEVPYAMPSLIWNTMMSVSGGWFFVVASEAITVSHHQVLLPGIGSYIALAIQQRDLTAIGWAILAMLVVILLYDQFAFRPLVAWADKFKVELSQAAEPPSSWFLDLLQRTRLLASVLAYAGGVRERLRGVRLLPRLPRVRLHRRRERRKRPRLRQRGGRWRAYAGLGLLAVTAVGSVLLFTHFVLSEASYGEIGWVFVLGFFTLVRVVVLIFLASLV
ncbi:MAG TPA: ABC transporter permease subunit, partial [Gammaproteobacteria bacterium]|nr:ABC transporter permease subunit [Gammaproteobacteria bacterium]